MLILGRTSFIFVHTAAFFVLALVTTFRLRRPEYRLSLFGRSKDFPFLVISPTIFGAYSASYPSGCRIVLGSSAGRALIRTVDLHETSG